LIFNILFFLYLCHYHYILSARIRAQRKKEKESAGGILPAMALIAAGARKGKNRVLA